MYSEYPSDPKQLRAYNFAKYDGIPPSWELIESVIERSGLKKLARFECVWLMPRSTLTWYKTGIFPLPAKYWHIFYDFDNVSKIIRSKKRTNSTCDSTYILPTNKRIIHEYQ